MKTATSGKTISHGAPATSPERLLVHRVNSSYFVEKSLLSPAIPEQPVLISWGTGCCAAHPLAFTANLVQNRLDQQGSHRDWTAVLGEAVHDHAQSWCKHEHQCSFSIFWCIISLRCLSSWHICKCFEVPLSLQNCWIDFQATSCWEGAFWDAPSKY